jgi:hypothetical protein
MSIGNRQYCWWSRDCTLGSEPKSREWVESHDGINNQFKVSISVPNYQWYGNIGCDDNGIVTRLLVVAAIAIIKELQVTAIAWAFGSVFCPSLVHMTGYAWRLHSNQHYKATCMCMHQVA